MHPRRSPRPPAPAVVLCVANALALCACEGAATPDVDADVGVGVGVGVGMDAGVAADAARPAPADVGADGSRLPRVRPGLDAGTPVSRDGALPAGVLHHESFDDDQAPGWRLVKAAVVKEQFLQVGNWPESKALALYDGADFSGSFVLSAQVSGAGGGDGNRAKIFFNYENDQNHYVVELGGGLMGKIQLAKVAAGTRTLLGPGTYKHTTEPFKSYWRWPTVEVRFEEGGHITVSAIVVDEGVVDRTVLFDRVADPAFASGKIGFGAANNIVQVDEVLVRRF